MVKLSITMPFYETYDLTVKLLDRLIPQLTDETELIIKDDSNDLRLDAYKDYATIIHTEKRQGLPKARNIAIELAKGKYVAFIDSDDMVSEDYVETLLKAIDEHNEDIIFFNWQDMSTGEIVRHPRNYAVWKAIYKREMVPRFNEEMKYNEDVDFQGKIDCIEHTEYDLDKLLYFYNSNRVGSQMWKKLHKGE